MSFRRAPGKPQESTHSSQVSCSLSPFLSYPSLPLLSTLPPALPFPKLFPEDVEARLGEHVVRWLGQAPPPTTSNMHPSLPLSNGSDYFLMLFSGHRVNNAVRCLKFRQMKNFRPIEFGNAMRWAWPSATTSLSPPRAGHGPAPLAPSRCLHPPSRDTGHSSAVWVHLFFFFSHCLHFL